MKPRIYLAGPITGLSYGEARFGWRKEFAEVIMGKPRVPNYDWPDDVAYDLDRCPIELYSPMRQEGHLAEIQEIEHKAYAGSVLSQAKGIVAKDRLDVQRSDVIVAGFLGAKIISAGTLIELGWADAFDKTTILIMEPDGSNPHDRFFITEMADFRVATVREAAEVAKAILMPGI